MLGVFCLFVCCCFFLLLFFFLFPAFIRLGQDFSVRAMDYMCVQTRSRFLLSSERVLGDLWFFFKQYVTCATRGDKTLDQCYGNIPRTYKSVALPSVGGSDHNTIQLIPESHLISSRLCPSTAGCSPPSMSSIFVCLLPS